MHVLVSRHRPSPALVVACLALLVALSGTGYAALRLPARSVGAKQLKKNAVVNQKIASDAVTGAKVKDGSLTGADLLESSLGKVPSASAADNAGNLDGVDSTGFLRASAAAGGALGGSYPNPLIRRGAVGANQLGGAIVVNSTPVSIPAGGNGGAFAVCPTGSQLLSGGGTSAGPTVVATDSQPSTNTIFGDGWLWSAHNFGPATTIRAMALCLS